MVSSEVQRTLVKSPPELWAEISDPEALARHLGEFGEIRITRVHPEQKIEWEAPEASGSVVIKPSGWGTKVKLTVSRELPPPPAAPDQNATAPLDSAPQREPGEAHEVRGEQQASPEEPDSTSQAIVAVAEAAAESAPASDPESERIMRAEPEEALGLEPEPEIAEANASTPQPRRGFFARLFGRRRASAAGVASDRRPPETLAGEDREALGDDAIEPAPSESSAEFGEPSMVRLAPAAETASDRAGEATQQPPTEDHDPPIGAAASSELAPGDGIEPDEPSALEESRAAEELAAEEVTAVLSGVLDRLGAAHHRPFSRA